MCILVQCVYHFILGLSTIVVQFLSFLPSKFSVNTFLWPNSSNALSSTLLPRANAWLRDHPLAEVIKCETISKRVSSPEQVGQSDPKFDVPKATTNVWHVKGLRYVDTWLVLSQLFCSRFVFYNIMHPHSVIWSAFLDAAWWFYRFEVQGSWNSCFNFQYLVQHGCIPVPQQSCQAPRFSDRLPELCAPLSGPMPEIPPGWWSLCHLQCIEWIPTWAATGRSVPFSNACWKWRSFHRFLFLNAG